MNMTGVHLRETFVSFLSFLIIPTKLSDLFFSSIRESSRSLQLYREQSIVTSFLSRRNDNWQKRKFVHGHIWGIQTRCGWWVLNFVDSELHWTYNISLSSKGNKLLDIIFPCKQVISAAWGGKYLNELFVTTAAYDFFEPQPAVAGQLFVVRGLGEKGCAGVKACV